MYYSVLKYCNLYVFVIILQITLNSYNDFINIIIFLVNRLRIYKYYNYLFFKS